VIAILVASFCNLGGSGRPALGVFQFPEPGKPTLLVSAEPLAGITGITGLAADERYVYAVGQVPFEYAVRQVPFDARGAVRRAPLSTLLTFDRRDLSLRDRYTFRLGRDVHSLALLDGGLMAVSTGTDALVELAVRDGRVVDEHVHWRADPIGQEQDLIHLNAVAVQRGGPADGRGALLVSGFGRRTGRSWSSARKGFIRRVGVWDGAPGAVLAAGLMHPHSVLDDGHDVLLCASYDRAVRTLGEGEWLTGLPGYARGLCRIRDTVYVATSVGRRRSRSGAGPAAPLGNPHDAGRPTGDCTVVGVDRSTGLPVSQVVLTPVVKEIYDLLYLDPPATPASDHWRVEKLVVDAARDGPRPFVSEAVPRR
jgi:Domain of unknown function (DUF4915)